MPTEGSTKVKIYAKDFQIDDVLEIISKIRGLYPDTIASIEVQMAEPDINGQIIRGGL